MSVTISLSATSRLVVAAVFKPLTTPLNFGNFHGLILCRPFNYTNISQFKYEDPPSRHRDRNVDKSKHKTEVSKNRSNIGSVRSIIIPKTSSRDETLERTKNKAKSNINVCDTDTSNTRNSSIQGSKKVLNKIRTKKRFSQEEDLLILSDVNQFGNKEETFKLLCIKLGRKNWAALRNRFYLIQDPDIFEKRICGEYSYRKYSEEEDEIIMNYVKDYGESYQTFNSVAKVLDRHVNGVRQRFVRITGGNGPTVTKHSTKKQKDWSLEGDETIIKYIFQVIL